ATVRPEVNNYSVICCDSSHIRGLEDDVEKSFQLARMGSLRNILDQIGFDSRLASARRSLTGRSLCCNLYHFLRTVKWFIIIIHLQELRYEIVSSSPKDI
ncbi:unnamed protein product, partial [Clavelina lepadiformis]